MEAVDSSSAGHCGQRLRSRDADQAKMEHGDPKQSLPADDRPAYSCHQQIREVRGAGDLAVRVPGDLEVQGQEGHGD
jgi:hypothetical protein